MAASFKQIVDIITFVGFPVAVVALLVTVWQARKTLQQAQDFKEIKDNAEETLKSLGPLGEKTDKAVQGLDRVMQELSTHVMGEWPGVLSEFARFVASTDRYLKILADVPSYGIFSNLDGHREYQRALEER